MQKCKCKGKKKRSREKIGKAGREKGQRSYTRIMAEPQTWVYAGPNPNRPTPPCVMLPKQSLIINR